MKYVISLGGSVILPEGIDIHYLKRFRRVILDFIKKHRSNKIIIICGGGKISREYQRAARGITRLSSDDVDWLGIHATRINAHLLRTIFREYAHRKVVRNPHEKIRFNEKILIASGWKPGWSTDYDAVILARNFGVKTIINISNIDYAYDKDPNKHKNAKIIKKISWKAFRKLIPKKWSPGLSSPFDPVASRKAEKYSTRVLIVGKGINNLKNIFNNKKFKGTVIS